jgi:uroporphyrinogen decarboxylase
LKTDKPLIAEIITSGKSSTKIPIWLMRQAGRSLPEYLEAVKDVTNFIDICYNTELMTELTMQPIKRFDMDAAIIFSDILLIANVLGCNVNFIRGIGPKIVPIETSEKLQDIDKIEHKVLPTLNAIRKVRSMLPKDKSLIGFAGGPWTVASYIVEGGSSKSFCKVKNLPISDLKKIIDKLTEATIIYLTKQIEAGVDIIQLFDSNAGILPKELFMEYIIEPTKKIVSAIRHNFGNFPIIGFPRRAESLYRDYCEQTDVSAISIDYDISIEWAKENLRVPIQGNLHPNLLAYDMEETLVKAQRIIDCFQHSPFVFNLGHGVLPETPIENINELVKFVKSFRLSSSL